MSDDTERDVARGIQRQKQAEQTSRTLGAVGCFGTLILLIVILGTLGYAGGPLVIGAFVVALIVGIAIENRIRASLLNR